MQTISSCPTNMQRRAFLRRAGQACAALYLALATVGAAAREQGPLPAPESGDRGSALDVADWETISALLDDASSTYTETWDDATCRTLMSGGYLGNGDFGAHLGGTRHCLKYYLGKNGFHAGNDVAGFRSGDDAAPGPYKQHILNLALLTIEASAGAESGTVYRVTQDLRNAEVRTDCTMAGSPVQTKAYLSPSSNALVLELSTNGGTDVRLQATLSVIGNAYVAKSAGTAGAVAWVTKEPNAEGAPFYVKGAVAAKSPGRNDGRDHRPPHVCQTGLYLARQRRNCDGLPPSRTYEERGLASRGRAGRRPGHDRGGRGRVVRSEQGVVEAVLAAILYQAGR